FPQVSGVYLFYPSANSGQAREPMYIGKAINIRERVKNHFQQPTYKDNIFIKKITRIGYLETDSEIEALLLEAKLIKQYQHKFNAVWRDDKNYFYVAVSVNAKGLPYVYITHQPGVITKEKTTYIGPFVEGNALKKTLKYLRRVFPYYTSAIHGPRPCTWCHLGLCPGPLLLENLPSPEATARQREYQKNIKKLILILQGKRTAVV